MGRLLSFAIALNVGCTDTLGGLSFITVGDWGGAALEETSKPYNQNVKDVAAQMAKTADAKKVQFVVNTGDNFYWCGIQNTSDFQVKKDWVDTYSAPSLQVPWYSILGNHEYAYNVTAQVDLSNFYPNWIMDDRYYTRRVQLEKSSYATFIFIDTSPCYKEYRADSKSGWDPCGNFPTCSLSGGGDEFEGPCDFHEHIMTQDCTKQFNWFKSTLAAVPKEDWLIVVGHNPADEIDVEDFTSEMQSHGFDLYLNGHTHSLVHYTVDGRGAYVTSGAGALAHSGDQLGGSPGKDRTYNKAHNLKVEVLADASLSSSGHSYKSVFSSRQSGFTLHTFSDDYSSLTTDFLDIHGSVIHTFTVTKENSPSPAPTPSPPSPTPRPTPAPRPPPSPSPAPRPTPAPRPAPSPSPTTPAPRPTPSPSPAPRPTPAPAGPGRCCYDGGCSGSDCDGPTDYCSIDAAHCKDCSGTFCQPMLENFV